MKKIILLTTILISAFVSLNAQTTVKMAKKITPQVYTPKTVILNSDRQNLISTSSITESSTVPKKQNENNRLGNEVKPKYIKVDQETQNDNNIKRKVLRTTITEVSGTEINNIDITEKKDKN